jgi:CRISPR-associated exonuclease Cas4
MKAVALAPSKADVGEMDATSHGAVGEREMIPLSALNQFLYCPRRAALIHVEGIFKDNEHTVLGNIVHEHADLAGYEVAKGVTVLRALPVWSDRLGLSGKCDVVEVHSLKSKVQSLESEGGPNPAVGSYESLAPVEYKKGKRRAFENDDAQLCAQGLCLEEMFGLTVPRGAVFHAASKRRREVEFTVALRKLTEEAIAELHRVVASGSVPTAVFKPACEECSLYEICLPQVTSRPGGLERAGKRLFET